MRRHQKRTSDQLLSFLVLILLTGLLSGCGTSAAHSSLAPTAALTASPTTITAGTSATLAWTSTNGASASINNGIGTVALAGSMSVTPTQTITYTITVNGSGTATAIAQATVTVSPVAAGPTVTISANPTSITASQSSTLTVAASNASTVVVTDNTDSNNYPLAANGGTQAVSPATTTTYTATATGANNQTATATATLTVSSGSGNVTSINHVIFMLQENRSFDTYFGMLNPYRQGQRLNIGDDGKDYEVDGIDDKLSTISNMDDEGDVYSLYKFATSCIDEESSAWLESYGDVDRYNFLASRPISMDGFVHNAEGLAKSCAASGTCSGSYTDLTGRRAMGYYDQTFLNYYYFMASQFALSDRWFSPVSSKSIPNRVATFTGGTTQGLVRDPGNDDHLSQLNIPTIFQELDQANVSWKVYYTVTDDLCLAGDNGCSGSGSGPYPATTFSYLSYSSQYLYENPSGTPCTGTTQGSSVVGDTTNSFCIDPNHVAPLSHFFNDLTKGTLPSFAFIEAGYGNNDEHPGSAQSILDGQAQVANILNSFMSSSSWKDSVFFLSYDEGGGPYDHVPPVPGHSNDYTDASLGTIPDISQIAVNADSYFPCVPSGGTPTTHCDLTSSDPGANSGDAPAVQGFAAQLGFRLPNMIVSPFTRRHYVSHMPMDHTAVIKFVENRFISSTTHLTPRDAAQPNLQEFFDFNAVPWATPPSPPAPASPTTLGYNPCTPANLGP